MMKTETTINNLLRILRIAEAEGRFKKSEIVSAIAYAEEIKNDVQELQARIDAAVTVATVGGGDSVRLAK